MDFADLSIPLYVGAKRHGRRGREIILHVDAGCSHLTARRRSPAPLIATREQRLTPRSSLPRCGDGGPVITRPLTRRARGPRKVGAWRAPSWSNRQPSRPDRAHPLAAHELSTDERPSHLRGLRLEPRKETTMTMSKNNPNMSSISQVDQRRRRTLQADRVPGLPGLAERRREGPQAVRRFQSHRYAPGEGTARRLMTTAAALKAWATRRATRPTATGRPSAKTTSWPPPRPSCASSGARHRARPEVG